MAPRKNKEATKAKKGSGLRRRYGGKMGVRKKVKGQKYVIVPRAFNSGSTVTASSGWSLNDTHDPSYGKTGIETKNLKGEHKVQMPAGRIRYVKGAA